MKIGLTEITKTIEDCRGQGYDLKMNEIAYVFLLQYFKDKNIVYKILFGSEASDAEISKFDTSAKMKFLKKYLKANYIKGKEEDNVDSQYSDISFEDNKEAMIKMIEEAEKKYKNNEIEWDKYSDRVSKLRIALNDKFKVSEKLDEQRIIVNNKYNDICPYCHHEIRSKEAEDAIREIKEKYDLVPKQKTEEDIYE